MDYLQSVHASMEVLESEINDLDVRVRGQKSSKVKEAVENLTEDWDQLQHCYRSLQR